jgi:hypothetical protein
VEITMPTTKLREPRIATATKVKTDALQAGSNATDKISVNAAFSGGGSPNATMRFTIDGKANAATASADADGVWNFNPIGLADGQHTIVASEADSTGDHVTASLTFSLDVTEPAITQWMGAEEPAQQSSSDALDKADRLIKMFLDEIKRSNKTTRPNGLEFRREIRQQFGKKIALEVMLFKDAEQILDKYSVHPLEQNWIMCRARREKTIERPVTERELSRLFCVKKSVDVTKTDVHEIVAMLIAQCDAPVTRGDSDLRSSGKEL